MELDSLWLTRLQRFIFRNCKDGVVDKTSLLNDGFSELFIDNAVTENYIASCDIENSYMMTNKLRYMPITIASFKLDHRNNGNRFNIHDPQLIKTTYKAAREYHLAATIVSANMQATLEGERMLLIMPAAMLAAFSCELYLKAMLLTYGRSLRGHGLKQLFENLPGDVQAKIIELLIERGHTKEDISLELDNLSEAFVEIRYYHERTGFAFDTVFLHSLLVVLYNYCEKIIPN